MKKRQTKKQTLGRKRGPVPPPGGRVRITVNLPIDLFAFVQSLPGRSTSDKIVAVMARLKPLSKGI